MLGSDPFYFHFIFIILKGAPAPSFYLGTPMGGHISIYYIENKTWDPHDPHIFGMFSLTHWVKTAFSHLRFKEYKFKDNPKPNIQVMIGLRVYQSLLAFKKNQGKEDTYSTVAHFPFRAFNSVLKLIHKKIDTPYSSGSNLTVSQCFDQPPTFSWEKSHRFSHFFLVNLWPSGHAHVAGASAGSAPPLASAANARTAASPEPDGMWVASGQ